MERHRPIVKPMRDHLVGKIAAALWILLATVGVATTELVAKIVYNAAGTPAPFDADSGWWIVPNARELASYHGSTELLRAIEEAIFTR